ncbi:MAG: hypothetical protein JSV36_04875, partial [Anaerolineae bacterium]
MGGEPGPSTDLRLRLRDGEPLAAGDVATRRIAGRVGLSIRRLGYVCERQPVSSNSGWACRPIEAPQAPRTGSFRAGAIDLTGDGIAEQVRRVEEQVVIYRDGVELWQGLPEWRVLDLALGDPNDDGRGELLLALWKPDA